MISQNNTTSSDPDSNGNSSLFYVEVRKRKVDVCLGPEFPKLIKMNPLYRLTLLNLTAEVITDLPINRCKGLQQHGGEVRILTQLQSGSRASRICYRSLHEAKRLYETLKILNAIT